MHIVCVMGSPRKKDSYRVCKEIEAKINDGKLTMEYLFLNELNIQDCKGCDQCFKKDDKLCPCKDDITVVRNKLVEADGLIFASPVYAYQVPAPLKRFIDRLSFLFHRQELVGKPALLIVTSEGGGHKQVANYLSMTATGWGCHIVDKINIISPMYFDALNTSSAWGYNDKYANKMHKTLMNATTKFMDLMQSNHRPIPTFGNIFMFNCLRSKTYTSKADYDYWKMKGWLESDYFYETHLNVFKKVFGKLIKSSIDLASRKLDNKIKE